MSDINSTVPFDTDINLQVVPILLESINDIFDNISALYPNKVENQQLSQLEYNIAISFVLIQVLKELSDSLTSVPSKLTGLTINQLALRQALVSSIESDAIPNAKNKLELMSQIYNSLPTP